MQQQVFAKNAGIAYETYLWTGKLTYVDFYVQYTGYTIHTVFHQKSYF
jgi:hypothetical protein